MSAVIEPTIYHGIDIVDIDRIVKAVARWGDHFLQRVFTQQELDDAQGRSSSLAARFAAKEAVAKALGVGLRGIGARPQTRESAVAWREIEIVRQPGGQPALCLHGRAARRATELRWQKTSVSLSHARHIAIASVVAIVLPPP